jgi:hypothetical protein
MKTIRTRTISVRLSKTDFLRMSDVLQRRAARVAGVRVHIEPWIAAISAMLLGYWVATAIRLDTLLALSVGVALALAASLLMSARARRRELKKVLRDDGSFLRPFHFRADDRGVEMDSDHSSMRVKWAGVHAIETTPELIFLYVDHANALVLPATAFQNHVAMEAFAGELRFLKMRSESPAAVAQEAAS